MVYNKIIISLLFKFTIRLFFILKLWLNYDKHNYSLAGDYFIFIIDGNTHIGLSIKYCLITKNTYIKKLNYFVIIYCFYLFEHIVFNVYIYFLSAFCGTMLSVSFFFIICLNNVIKINRNVSSLSFFYAQPDRLDRFLNFFFF